jgi:hypothetical protein
MLITNAMPMLCYAMQCRHTATQYSVVREELVSYAM